MITQEQFDTAIQAIQTVVDTQYNQPGSLVNRKTIEIERGKKYARIVAVTDGSRSAFGFFDMTTGDLLKAAGWKGPAKGVRGNMFDASFLRRVSPYGVA